MVTEAPESSRRCRFAEIRFAGSGGQGVILMGVVFAVAATRDHYCVVQTQSYGPEARGGYSRSDVIVSDRRIDYPQLLGLDVLVALTDEAAHRYAGGLSRAGKFIYDAEEVPDPPATSGARFGIPFSRLNMEATGRAQTANILVLGAVVGLTGIVSAEALRESVPAMVPEGTEELNLRAMQAGLDLDPEEWRE